MPVLKGTFNFWGDAMGPGGWNSGPHTCQACTHAAELNPQPQFKFSNWCRGIDSFENIPFRSLISFVSFFTLKLRIQLCWCYPLFILILLL